MELSLLHKKSGGWNSQFEHIQSVFMHTILCVLRCLEFGVEMMRKYFHFMSLLCFHVNALTSGEGIFSLRSEWSMQLE